MKFKGKYAYNRQTPCVYNNIKVVFHGIPKNASTTVKNALYSAEHGTEFIGNKQWVHKGNEKGGSYYPPLSEIETNYDDYLHIAVVRNPYDRFRSFYSDLTLFIESGETNGSTLSQKESTKLETERKKTEEQFLSDDGLKELEETFNTKVDTKSIKSLKETKNV